MFIFCIFLDDMIKYILVFIAAINVNRNRKMLLDVDMKCNWKWIKSMARGSLMSNKGGTLNGIK